MSETAEFAIPKKILIVRLGAMGDVIHAIPAVAKLRALFPAARIGWVIEKRWSELLRLHSLVDFVHTVDTRKWRKNVLNPESIREAVRAISLLHDQRYDAAIDFQGAMKSAVISAFSGARERYGFANPWEKPSGIFYTHPVHVRAKHVVEQNIELVMNFADVESRPHSSKRSLSGAPVPTPILKTDTHLYDWAADRIRELDLTACFVILNPSAGWGAKQWPVERYAEVARALGRQGIRSLVNYGPGEEELARHVQQASEGHAIAATFTISELMAITSRAALFIGGDTGPMHLAALLQIPVVAIFGPTDPARTGPYGTRSIVLRDPSSVTSHKRYRETEAGLRNITTEQVLNAALELLQISREGVRA